MTYNGLASLVIGGGLGFYLPEIMVRILRKQRDRTDLPVAARRARPAGGVRRSRPRSRRRPCAACAKNWTTRRPTSASELNLANMQLQMGRPRREVLHDLGVRTGVDDMKALVAILIQADRFGSSIAQALRVQSDSMRVKRRQLAEEKAAQTAVKMIFPLVLFIFPGIFVVLVGPAAIMMIRQLLTV